MVKNDIGYIMKEHKYNCIKLHYHLGHFQYFCGDSIFSTCKYYESEGKDGIDCRHADKSKMSCDYVCKSKAAQKDAKIEIYDSLECD